MARKIRKGATDISVILRAIDSTTGAPKTDFAYNTAGIDLWYRRNGATVTSITEATLAAADTAHSDGGVIHLGNGYFRLDSPDAAFATGVNSVMFGGTATGIIIIGTEIQLVNYDPEDSVRLGLTALPPADADAPGGIPISDAGSLDLDAKLANTNEVTAARMGALTDLINDGRLDLIFDAIKTATDKMNFTGTYINAQIKASDNIDFGALQKTSLNAATPASVVGAVGSVTGNVGGNVNGSVGSVATTVSANLVSILGTALTETAGYLAAGFKKFFNVAAPVMTAESVNQTKDAGTLHDFDPASDVVAHVTLTDTCTTNTDMRGTNSALLASGYTAPDNASITSIKGKTDQLTFTTANKVDATATVSTTGIATEANQTTIINHLTEIKGATFDTSIDSLEAIRNRGDIAWITGGTGGGSNAVTINVKDDSAVNVVDCYVEIWDSAGTSFISRTNTNSSGDVTFNLDSNTYIVKMHKTGYYFTNQTLVVNGTESEAYTGTILTPDAATDPTLCRIYGYYFDPSGATYSAVKSLIKLTAIYEASDNNYYTSELIGTYNTTTGLLYFDVIQGASVTLEIPILNIKKSFVVPAQTLYKISDIA